MFEKVSLWSIAVDFEVPIRIVFRFDREKLSGLGPRNLRQWTTTKLSRTSRRRSRAARSHPRVRVFKRSIQRTNRRRYLCLSFMDRRLWQFDLGSVGVRR